MKTVKINIRTTIVEMICSVIWTLILHLRLPPPNHQRMRKPPHWVTSVNLGTWFLHHICRQMQVSFFFVKKAKAIVKLDTWQKGWQNSVGHIFWQWNYFEFIILYNCLLLESTAHWNYLFWLNVEFFSLGRHLYYFFYDKEYPFDETLTLLTNCIHKWNILFLWQ